MEIVDAQIHVWEERPRPGYHWDTTLPPMKAAVPVEHAIASMDAVGVQAAVLNLPPHYRRDAGGYFIFDNSYAEDAARTYPGRIVSAGRVDNADPELEDRLRALMKGAGVVALRVAVQRPASIELVKEGAFDRLFKACEDQEVPVMILAQPYLDVLCDIVKRFPALNLILDHLALPQPSETMKMDPEPFQRIDAVLELANFENVSVKLSGAPTLSKEQYPFGDLWPFLHRYIEAFGPARLMWGSDFTRCRGMHNYSEGLNFLRYTDELAESDKELILGQTLRRVLGWAAPMSA